MRCLCCLHQWSLLRHLPCLENLKITDCSDLTYACGSTDLVECISSLEDLTVKDCKSDIVALQEKLGDFTSPTGLILSDCNGIKSLLESVQQLRCLRRLVITNCPEGPELVQWCKSEENKIKLAHIREIVCACQSIHYNVLYLHWLLLFVILAYIGSILSYMS